MEDERHGIGPNGIFRGTPENTGSQSKNMINSTPSKININLNNPTTPTTNAIINTTGNNNKEQDRFLPIANVGRIMKKVIPGNGKISKDAKETVQECVSEFISFITGEASDKCQREKRKTINGDDIIWAITTLGFEEYVEPLKQYLSKYRELEGEKLNAPKQQWSEQQQQQQQCLQQQSQDQNPIIPCNAVYSTTNIMSPPSFVSTDQSLALTPYSTNLIPRQLHPQESIDSVGHW